jgi:hypothetical protein
MKTFKILEEMNETRIEADTEYQAAEVYCEQAHGPVYQATKVAAGTFEILIWNTITESENDDGSKASHRGVITVEQMPDVQE